MVSDKELVGKAKVAFPVCGLLAIFAIILVFAAAGLAAGVFALGIGTLFFLSGLAMGVQVLDKS